MARVLIVDDDVEIRAVLRLVCEDADYEVEACDGPHPALDWLRANGASAGRAIILVDDHMPGMIGLQFLRLAAGDEELRGPHRYILMTADTQSAAAAERAPDLRGILAAILVKPFDLDVFLALLARVANG